MSDNNTTTNLPLSLGPPSTTTSTTSSSSSSQQNQQQQQQPFDQSRMNSLFFWAIQNSDPTKLKSLSQQHNDQQQSSNKQEEEALLKQKAQMLFGNQQQSSSSTTTTTTTTNDDSSTTTTTTTPVTHSRSPIDAIQHMKNQLNILSMTTEERLRQGITNEDRFYSLIKLRDVIDKIDFANDFHKLNGTQVMLNILNEFLQFSASVANNKEDEDDKQKQQKKNEEEEELYTLALEALDNMITCLHNNGWLQTQALFQSEAFPFVMNLLLYDGINDDSENQSENKQPVMVSLKTRTRMQEKLVSLLSALCSNQGVSLLRFLELDGIQRLMIPLIQRNTNHTALATEENEEALAPYQEYANKLTTKLLFLLFNLMICEEGAPQKTSLATQILLHFDQLILVVLERFAHLENDSEIDLVEKALLVLRDLAMADHVRQLYRQTTKSNSRLAKALDQIMESAKAHEDQDRVYDVKDYIDEIKSY